MNQQVIKKMKRLCKKFHDDLQELFESTDQETYEMSNTAQTAVIAQGYAIDAAETEEQSEGEQ